MTSTSAQTKGRRDFIVVASNTMLAVGLGAVAYPFINQMNPAADTLALASIEVDISALQIGQAITVKWRGRPVFIRRRTRSEIAEANEVPLADLRDPETDTVRAPRPEYLVVEGICTHLGCVPLGQKVSEVKGDYAGWFCPCHGSHYDTSGRIRKGPAPSNLPIPPYEFITDTVIRIG